MVAGRRDKWRQRKLKTQEHTNREDKKRNSTKSNCNRWASTAPFITSSSQKIKLGITNQQLHPSGKSSYFAVAFALMNRHLFWPNAQILPYDWANIRNNFWFIQRDVPLNTSPWIRTVISKYWISKMNVWKKTFQSFWLCFYYFCRGSG